MNKYPFPNYDEIRKAKVGNYSLTSYIGKGCSHSGCSFCGINEKAQYLRNTHRIFEEIKYLIKLHGNKEMYFGDWEINGNPEKLEELCDLLITNRIKIESWAEINPRHTSPSLFKKMKLAGITRVQIGIESFSSNVLKAIGKPATVLDNIKVLIWGIEAGMENIYFNILCNHPLSKRCDVEDNFRVFRNIAHLLRPPVALSLNEMELYRTSNLYAKADYFRISNIRNYKYYQRCYPTEAIGVEIPMYNLSCRWHIVHPLWKKVEAFLQKIRRNPVKLNMRKIKNGLQIYDSRTSIPKRYKLEGLDAYILYLTHNRIVSQKDISKILAVPEEKTMTSLSRLERKKIIMKTGNRYLSLPIKKKIFLL